MMNEVEQRDLRAALGHCETVDDGAVSGLADLRDQSALS